MKRIDHWINEGFGWITESINGEYVNISIYNPLSAISYIELPNKMKNSKKGLINVNNNDNKCFVWCYIEHLNSFKIHPQEITN